MALQIKTFRVHDLAEEQAVNQFLENKVVRHWSVSFVPTGNDQVGTALGGAWNIFVAYEIKEDRPVNVRSNEGRGERSDQGRNDRNKQRPSRPERPKVERANPEQMVNLPAEDMPLYEAIRRWRNARAREENVKPFTLFNNKQLEDLVKAKPGTLDDLRTAVPDMREDLYDRYKNELLGFITGATPTVEAHAPAEASV